MKFFVFLIATFGIGIAILSIDALNRAAIFGSSGYIDSGSKFGIKVGMEYKIAVETLEKRGLQVIKKTPTPATCIYREYSKGKILTGLYDTTWRRGTICLLSAQGKITNIEWQFGLGIP